MAATACPAWPGACCCACSAPHSEILVPYIVVQPDQMLQPPTHAQPCEPVAFVEETGCRHGVRLASCKLRLQVSVPESPPKVQWSTLPSDYSVYSRTILSEATAVEDATRRQLRRSSAPAAARDLPCGLRLPLCTRLSPYSSHQYPVSEAADPAAQEHRHSACQAALPSVWIFLYILQVAPNEHVPRQGDPRRLNPWQQMFATREVSTSALGRPAPSFGTAKHAKVHRDSRTLCHFVSAHLTKVGTRPPCLCSRALHLFQSLAGRQSDDLPATGHCRRCWHHGASAAAEQRQHVASRAQRSAQLRAQLPL